MPTFSDAEAPLGGRHRNLFVETLWANFSRARPKVVEAAPKLARVGMICSNSTELGVTFEPSVHSGSASGRHISRWATICATRPGLLQGTRSRRRLAFHIRSRSRFCEGRAPREPHVVLEEGDVAAKRKVALGNAGLQGHVPARGRHRRLAVSPRARGAQVARTRREDGPEMFDRCSAQKQWVQTPPHLVA